MIHLEGMGVIGSYLAWRLYLDGVDFTWHDTDERINAWQACTGAIFPTGHADDLEAHATWYGHLRYDSFRRHMECGLYTFSQKHPPHGGRYDTVTVPGDSGLQIASLPSIHLNAQTFVPATREAFAHLRRPEWPAFSRRVITHGFGPRLARFMWGWTVPVRLGFAEVDEREDRPCIYCREGRFTMAYAYPIPGTNNWYAGSSLISQRVPKKLAVEAKYLRWREDFMRLTRGYVLGVARAGQPIHGWRPVPQKGDDEWVKEMPDGTWAARVLWHSGVRHAPHVYNALREKLGCQLT